MIPWFQNLYEILKNKVIDVPCTFQCCIPFLVPKDPVVPNVNNKNTNVILEIQRVYSKHFTAG